VLTSKAGVPDHRLVMNFGQPAGLAHAIAFGDVFVNGDDGCIGKAGIEKNGAPTFGKGRKAMSAIQQAGVFRAVGGADSDIFFPSNAVFRTLFIPTKKVLQVVHDNASNIKRQKTKNINYYPEE